MKLLWKIWETELDLQVLVLQVFIRVIAALVPEIIYLFSVMLMNSNSSPQVLLNSSDVLFHDDSVLIGRI